MNATEKKGLNPFLKVGIYVHLTAFLFAKVKNIIKAISPPISESKKII